jgi:hypothetical protein
MVENDLCNRCEHHKGSSASCPNKCCFNHPKYLDPETIQEKLDEGKRFVKK